jgi:hypothetical protein
MADVRAAPIHLFGKLETAIGNKGAPWRLFGKLETAHGSP